MQYLEYSITRYGAKWFCNHYHRCGWKNAIFAVRLCSCFSPFVRIWIGLCTFLRLSVSVKGARSHNVLAQSVLYQMVNDAVFFFLRWPPLSWPPLRAQANWARSFQWPPQQPHFSSCLSFWCAPQCLTVCQTCASVPAENEPLVRLLVSRLQSLFVPLSVCTSTLS